MAGDYWNSLIQQTRQPCVPPPIVQSWISHYADWAVVGHCPRCGAPIYAELPSASGNPEPPMSRHSCDCRNQQPVADGEPATILNSKPIR